MISEYRITVFGSLGISYDQQDSPRVNIQKEINIFLSLRIVNQQNQQNECYHINSNWFTSTFTRHYYNHHIANKNLHIYRISGLPTGSFPGDSGPEWERRWNWYYRPIGLGSPIMVNFPLRKYQKITFSKARFFSGSPWGATNSLDDCGWVRKLQSEWATL